MLYDVVSFGPQAQTQYDGNPQLLFVINKETNEASFCKLSAKVRRHAGMLTYEIPCAPVRHRRLWDWVWVEHECDWMVPGAC